MRRADTIPDVINIHGVQVDLRKVEANPEWEINMAMERIWQTNSAIDQKWAELEITTKLHQWQRQRK